VAYSDQHSWRSLSGSCMDYSQSAACHEKYRLALPDARNAATMGDGTEEPTGAVAPNVSTWAGNQCKMPPQLNANFTRIFCCAVSC